MGLRALIATLKKRKERAYVFIDDVSRLARDLRAYFAIRDGITAAGGIVVSPKFGIFSDDPEDDPREIFDAYFASKHRKQNAEQTVRRMRGRCLDGHWCLQLPKGYQYRRKQSRDDRAVIERKEPVAAIIKDALEGYASGHLETQAEVARFLAAHPGYPKDSTGRVRDEYAHGILTNPFYAGYVYVPDWDVSMRPGHHPALIAFETFQRIQRRLQSASKGIVRKDNSADFPLRGFVSCGCCGKPLTGCLSKSRDGTRHPYYHCFNRDCEAYKKSIRRGEIEGAFVDMLREMQPSPIAFDMTEKGLRILWQQFEDAAAERKKSLAGELAKTERDIKQLVDRVIATDSPALISAYEQRIREAEYRKSELKEQVAASGQSRGSFDDAFRTAMLFFASTYKIWISGRLELRRLVLKLAFCERLEYVPKSGFRTPLTTSPFRLLEHMKGGIESLARPAGFEPAASSLEGSCSIQLSYGRAPHRVSADCARAEPRS